MVDKMNNIKYILHKVYKSKDEAYEEQRKLNAKGYYTKVIFYNEFFSLFVSSNPKWFYNILNLDRE